MTTLDRYLDQARSQLGTRETAAGATKYGVWWGTPTVPWCAVFLAWCAERTDALDIIPRESYANRMIRWFADAGRVGQTPRVGAVAGFDWAGGGMVDRVDHVALVEAVHGDGTITTIGGNESNTVMRRRMGTRYVVAYGYPRYAAARPPTLRLGSTGDSVRLLQRLLGVQRDGVFGPLTEAAVRSYQRKQGLTVDGIVGSATWRQLGY